MESVQSSVVVFQVPFRQEVPLGEGRTIKIQRISRLTLVITGDDGGTFTVMNNVFTWRGYTIRAMVENSRVDLSLPNALARELGICPEEAEALVLA